MASQDLTLEALACFVTQLDGKPANEDCPHYKCSPAGMAWLVGAWLQKTGRRAMSACRAAAPFASVTCACQFRTLRPWFVLSEGEPQ